MGRPCIISRTLTSHEQSRSITQKARSRLVNGHGLKHHIVGNPLEMDTYAIQVITSEEFIKNQFWKPLESEKE